MRKILNLTQHSVTVEQKGAGVFDLEGEKLQELKTLLNFTTQPTYEEVKERAKKIAELADMQRTKENPFSEVMIGGALWLMKPLIEALSLRGLTAFFAYSEREVVEEPQADGSVKKTAIFKHKGFVPAWE